MKKSVGLGLVLSIVLAAIATPAARADSMSIGSWRIFQGTACQKWTPSGGTAHVGFDGILYNQHASEKLKVTCPIDPTLSYDHGRLVAITLVDLHPDQAIECEVFYHLPDGTFFSGAAVATVGVSADAQTRTLPLDANLNGTTKLICDIPPTAAGQWSHIRLYQYTGLQKDWGGAS
jgi:hypothetical protein